MCTQCRWPLVLDEAEFKCKPCCSRSVHASGETCCACRSGLGVCVKDGEAEEESGVDFSSLFTFMSGKHHENRSANNVIIGVSVMLLVVAGALIVGAVWSYCRMFAGRIGMRRSHEEREMYGKVQYSPLSENLEVS